MSRCERGGQSHPECCDRDGLALSTFQWWRRKLSAMGTERERLDAAGFVERDDDDADREGCGADT